MAPVFSHGRLRLYLLKLLAEGPKHGYELIRLLENRFLGLYAPSAGTIYPRLQRMEAEGLITHTQAGGRKVYEITDAGREELRSRSNELAGLESEIHASVADLATLANEIQEEVRGSVRDLKRELRDATREARHQARPYGRDWWDQTGFGQSRTGFPAAGGPSGRDEGTQARPAGQQTGAGTSSAAADDLERAAKLLANEVGRLARRAGVSDEELRAGAAVVISAITELRRLLHG